MIEHPDHHHHIHSAVMRIAPGAIEFKGVLFRACSPIFANTRDLLTGEGARQFGGRWNPPARFPTVYLAVEFEGAIAETLGVVSHYGFDPSARLPLTLVAVEATVSRVLDLTDASVRRALGVTLAQLCNCPWRRENLAGREALTQTLGRAASEAGLGGLRVPSHLKRSFHNLDIFPQNLRSTDVLRIRSADKLPPAPATGIA